RRSCRARCACSGCRTTLRSSPSTRRKKPRKAPKGEMRVDFLGNHGVVRLSSASRRCAPGVGFLAYPGEAADGRAYIGDAIQRGASAVLWEEQAFQWRSEWRTPNLPVKDLKQQAGPIAHELYGRPSESLWVCGVTGTNGKTSCSQWIAALLENAG